MSEEERISKEKGGDGLLSGRSVSRREFLKIAGAAGATVGVGAGLGGMLAACGGAAATTTTTSAAGSTTTSAAAGSGRWVGGEGGRPHRCKKTIGAAIGDITQPYEL